MTRVKDDKEIDTITDQLNAIIKGQEDELKKYNPNLKAKQK